MTDEEIVKLYWDRNEDAIRETSRKYGRYLTKIAYNVLSDEQDSEECVNDTYLKTWNSIPTNRPSMLPVYLGRIARMLSIDLYRKNHAIKRYASEYALSLEELGDTFSDGHTPEEILQREAMRAALNGFLRQLTPAARNMFIGRYYFFDPVKKIAADCGVAVGTVKSSLHRTRQALREYLTKEGFL